MPKGFAFLTYCTIMGYSVNILNHLDIFINFSSSKQTD